MPSRRSLSILLLLCCLILLAYSGFRAFHLSFTHDESLSYSFVAGDPTWKGTANNHPLNTRLMTWTNNWLGPREWSLRLPNLVAHVLYLGFGLVLLRQLKNPWLMIVGWSLLNLNPFLLDFFSLARGYGLAMGLSMGALFFLWRGYAQTDFWPTVISFLLSLTFASLADLANFSWVNVHLPLFAAIILILWFNHDLLNVQLSRKGSTVLGAFKLNGVWFGVTVFLAGINGWFLYNLSRRILASRDRGELYFGGQDGFISDTLGSLIDAYYYARIAPTAMKLVITAFGITALAVTIVALSYTTWKRRRISFSAILLVVVILAISLPTVEHHIFGTLYPMDRAALYYVPLWSLLAVFFVDENISFNVRIVSILAPVTGVLLVGVMIFHCLQTASRNRTYLWPYDAETRTVMIDIGKHFDSPKKNRQISIGNFWHFEPTINYYRALFHYDWLSRAARDPVVLVGHDIVYCYPAQLTGLEGRYTLLKAYPDTGTVLVQVNAQ